MEIKVTTKRLCSDVRCGLPSDHEGPCVPDEEETESVHGCDQCQMLNINGVNCHEQGCPNKNAHWSQEREQWIHYFECGECGDQIEVGESLCNCLEPDEDEDQPE